MDLTQVDFGKEYVIKKITAVEPLKSRLFSFGFARGNKVTVTEYTLTKQTYETKVEDSRVALRAEEAKNIEVEERA